MDKIHAIMLFIVAFMLLTAETLDQHMEERNKKVQPFLTECMCASGADPDEVAKWFANRTYSSSACFKIFTQCAAQKSGIMSVDGEINVAVLSKYPMISREQVDACNSAHNNTRDLADKLFQVTKCVQETINENAKNEPVLCEDPDPIIYV
uniref:Uncharacterized protein n=1 Tax=Photinus pyralis TaxID=7054 RepID=A0A1Y1KJN5_PHOPY